MDSQKPRHGGKNTKPQRWMYATARCEATIGKTSRVVPATTPYHEYNVLLVDRSWETLSANTPCLSRYHCCYCLRLPAYFHIALVACDGGAVSTSSHSPSAPDIFTGRVFTRTASPRHDLERNAAQVATSHSSSTISGLRVYLPDCGSG